MKNVYIVTFRSGTTAVVRQSPYSPEQLAAELKNRGYDVAGIEPKLVLDLVYASSWEALDREA